jgi:DNA repair photolyase
LIRQKVCDTIGETKANHVNLEAQPALFDVPVEKPTLRRIAVMVKEGGVDALTDAIRRADEATYQEVICRSALNAVQGMPFKWTLNPYRGCTHACHYCFARRYQTQYELDSDDQFSSFILVKTNLVEVLRRELAKPSWTREQVAVGTATDPYQPIEGHYRLTRRSLEALLEGRTPIGLVTKGPMAVRDKDVLADLSRFVGATVYFSVPSTDEEAWHALEPGTAHPLQRLRAVRELCDAGVRAGVLMAPIVPGFTDDPDKLEATVKAVADHGAAFVGANVLYLQDGTRDHFMTFLSREYPHLVDDYERMYAGKYAPSEYIGGVRSFIDILQNRYGLNARARPSGEVRGTEKEAAPEQAEQPELRWD